MSIGRQRAALARLEIHYIRALPWNVSLRMMLEYSLAPFAKQLQRDPKAAIGGLSAGNRLKQKIHRGAAPHRFQLRGDMSEAARLRRHAIGIDEPGQRAQNCANGFHGIRCRVYTNHCVATAEEK